VLAEGYKEYDTGRTYMARMGDWRNNKDEEIELDGIGGVNILVKADVHRSGMLKSKQAEKCIGIEGGVANACGGIGINFPCYPFENQAETEGFAKMAKRAGYQVVGLPNYVVWVCSSFAQLGSSFEARVGNITWKMLTFGYSISIRKRNRAMQHKYPTSTFGLSKFKSTDS
jgi:hypothetical protein